jgi:hypothetical protein
MGRDQESQMPYVRKIFTGEKARLVARLGSVSSRYVRPNPWFPEEVCKKIEKIVWAVYCLGEPGDDWQEFTAYDDRDRILSVHRMEGF